jgi:hypothetical protein
MTGAETLTVALGGHWNGRTGTGLSHCPNPNHADRHPSFSVADKGGRTMFICRSGCSQSEILSALRNLNLWHASRTDAGTTSREPFDWGTFCDPKIPTAEENAQFDLRFRLAHIRAELTDASHEIVELYARAKIPLTPADLARDLRLAVAVGGVGDAGFGVETVDRVITEFSRGYQFE